MVVISWVVTIARSPMGNQMRDTLSSMMADTLKLFLGVFFQAVIMVIYSSLGNMMFSLI